MSPFDFSVMFALGLVSSLHCVQMCGPIVLSYSVALESLTSSSAKDRVRSLVGNHLAYNSGRIFTYSALGAIAGFAGETMSVIGRISGLSQVLALVAGAAMIILGIAMLGLVPDRLITNRLLRIPALFLRSAGTLMKRPGAAKRFVLGVLLGFLPCGLVYAALIKAMATGTSVSGALSMFAFGLGTAGSLIAIGTFSSTIRLRLNRWGRQLAALGVTVMGILLVWRGTMPGMLMEHHMHGHH